MEEKESKKSNKIVTAIIVILILIIIVSIGVLIYSLYRNYKIEANAVDFVDDFNLNISSDDVEATTSGQFNYTYQGFNVLGIMEIPRTGFRYPVLDEVNKYALYVAVGVIYPNVDKLNQPGNVVIIGHNYKNNLLFSKNKYLEAGDKIYITDMDGVKMSYTIYDKFITDYKDTSFYARDTDGKAEITLSTCTDANDNERIIILARQD